MNSHNFSSLKPCNKGVNCQFKLNCRFAHSDSEKKSWQLQLSSQSDNFDKCKTFYNGFCSRIGCEFRHPKDCMHGRDCFRPDCTFRHPNAWCDCSKPNCQNRHVKPDYHLSIDNFAWPEILELFSGRDFKQRSGKATANGIINGLKKILIEALKNHNKDMNRDLDEQAKCNSWLGVNEKKKDELDLIRKRLEEAKKQRECFLVCIGRIIDAYLTDQLAFKDFDFALKREAYRLERNHLPALAYRSEFEMQIQTSQVLVVRGQTGSGKSTQLIQYLAELSLVSSRKKVICTQPRKLAAISLAERVAFEYGAGVESDKISPLGRFVGYRVGGRSLVSNKSGIIEFMTEEKFLNQIGSGRLKYNDVYAIVVDEAHERNINTDIILGILKQNIADHPNLKLVITSATIDPKIFSAYFFDSPTLDIPGRTYPVDVSYSPPSENLQIFDAVVGKALEIHQTHSVTSGDILCFLTGQDEVERAKIMIENHLEKNPEKNPNKQAIVLTAYGRQSPDDQKELFKQAPKNTRKIIFATDVAETSVTIDGVRYVVDSGLKKDVVFDPRKNMTSLQVMAISQSSAVQRQGRAGRTSSGICIRMYSRDEFETMPCGDVPELKRVPLANTVINFRKMDLDPETFDWLDPPEKAAIESAIEELIYLGAIYRMDEMLLLSELGDYIAETQLVPATAKMIFEGCRMGMGETAVKLAAVVQASDSFFWRVAASDVERRKSSDKALTANASEKGDLITMYNLTEKYEEMIQKKIIPDDVKQQQWTSIDDIGLAFEYKLNITSIEDQAEENNEEKSEAESYASSATSKSSASENLRDVESTSDVANMDDLDDDLNILSDEERNELNEIRQEEFENKQTKEFLVANKAAINGWLRRNFISEKALSIIRSANKSLLKTTQAVETVWKLNTTQNKKPVDESELALLLFRGMFLNYAVRTQNGQYHALRSKLIGRIHPGSVLRKLDFYPEFICFQNILNLNSVLFINPIQCESKWLNDVSEEFRSVVRREEPKKIEVGPKSASFLHQFVGKYGVLLREFEQSYDCMLEVDYTQKVLTAWTHKRSTDEIKNEINRRFEQIRNEAYLEVDQVPLNSSTSLLIGVGGELVNIICSDEFCSVVFRGLASKRAVDKIRESFKPNDLRSFRILQDQSAQNGNFVVHATFSEPNKAKDAKDRFDNELIEAKLVKCSPCNVLKPTAFKDITGQLKLIYGLGKSCGEANLTFLSAETANQAIVNLKQMFPTAIVNPIGKLAHQFARKANNETLPLLTNDKILFISPQSSVCFSVRIKNLSLSIGEIDLKKHLLQFRLKAHSIKVKRDAKVNQIAKNHLLEQIVDLNEIVPFMNELKPTLCEFSDEKRLLGGVVVTYPRSQDAQQAYDLIKNKNIQISQSQVQVDVEFNGTYSFHKELYKLFEKEIDEIKNSFLIKPDVVRIEKKENTDNKNQPKLVFFIKTNTLEILKQIQAQFEQIIKCDIYLNSRNNLLFSRFGREEMNRISTNVSYLHWDNRTGVVRIYGTEANRAKAKSEIDGLIERIGSLLEKTFILNREGINHFKKNKDDTLNIAGVNHVIRSMKNLNVTGTEQGLASFEKELDKRGFRNSTGGRTGATTNNKTECPFCSCDLEKPVTLSSCNHTACEECWSNMIEAGKFKLPIVCQYEKCNEPLFLNDLKRLVKNKTFTEIQEKALSDFVEKHSEEFLECPKVGCNQIFRMSVLKDKNKGEERVNGGKLVVNCDVCYSSYCLHCSKKQGKPCFSHPSELCDEMTTEFADQIHQHRTHLVEIFNPKCPKCQQTFYDFDGCCAVTCGKCKCSFCGICLKYHSRDAHSHVANCEKNPKRGQFFLEKNTIQQIWKERNIEMFNEYIQSIADETIRERVRIKCQKDLN